MISEVDRKETVSKGLGIGEAVLICEIHSRRMFN